MAIIEIKNLSKKYKKNDFYSLEAANFSLEEGEIVGLIGKNGAGKTTLLKLLTKALKPTSGSIIYDNTDINSKENILDDFGIMIEPVFYDYLSLEENLKFYLSIHQKQEYRKNIDSVLELVGLTQARNRKPKDFSFGMKQRTALAIALLCEPKIVILDEPFVGLDPIGVKRLLGILKEWSSSRKVSMLISSHQLAELEDICTRYVFIDNGKIANELDNKEDVLLVCLNKDKVISNDFLASYNLTIGNNMLEIPTSLSNEKVNDILAFLAKEKAINDIKHKKDDLAGLFTEN